MDYTLLSAVLAICLFSGCSLSLLEDDWTGFKLLHSRQYKNVEEEIRRRQIYEENKSKIEEHNKKFLEGEVSYELGMNQFGDMTNEEFSNLMLTMNETMIPAGDDVFAFNTVENVEGLPDTVDWRRSGAVTPVKHQGLCGSCWAFSAVASLESLHFKKTGKLLRLSEQNLVDCSTSYGNHGCQGGMPEYALNYILRNGINLESAYPYRGTQSRCKFDKKKVAATVKRVGATTQGREPDLKAAVATIGPISVCIDVRDSFRFYKRGVYKDPQCSRVSINHAVLVVGYGSEKGQDYWLIKNSWGTGWGEKGYIRMARNSNNQCAIANYARYPIV